MKKIILFLSVFIFISCNSSTKDLLDLTINEPSRKQINRSILGVNNFFVYNEFGSIPAQFNDIKNNLKINHIRILIAWTNEVQPSPSSPINFSFFDNILNNIPPGTDVLIVLSHTPNWMTNSANWIDGNPRKTWVEKFLKPVVSRYAGRPGVVGWEIFNEPDLITVASDSVLELTNADNYFEMLQLGHAAIRQIDPSRLAIMAATSSIQQKYPQNLDFNKRLFELGAENLTDIWNIHYYGKQFENVIRSGGVRNFLNALSKPIWITESGITGINEQLAYVETVWPFLTDEIRNIDRIYYYEYGNPSPLESNFGLRTTNPSFPVSDFYIYLRDN